MKIYFLFCKALTVVVSNSGQTKKVDQEIIAAVAGPSPVVPIPQQNFVSTGRYRDDG